MKIIYKEYVSHDYSSYSFPYCVYGIKEKGDAYHDLYTRGFLPYSNDLSCNEEIYYLARGVRIDLLYHSNKFKQNNIFNKFSGIYPAEKLSFRRVPKEQLTGDPLFEKWCLDHARNHFLKPDRLHYILERPYLKEILQLSCGDSLLASLLVVDEGRDFLHVWFSFYDTTVELNDFGKWVLMNVLGWCKKEGYRYFYIGTCYPPGGVYKLTLSPATSYFNGEGWDDDITKLKSEMLK